MNKVLVVDDNLVNVKLVQVTLTALGYEVVCAYNGVEGVEKTREERPDLIFMDIQMPEMDGMDAMKKIREDSDLNKIPIIAYTAYAMKGDRSRLISMGFDDYLSKPVTASNLISLIKKYLTS